MKTPDRSRRTNFWFRIASRLLPRHGRQDMPGTVPNSSGAAVGMELAIALGVAFAALAIARAFAEDPSKDEAWKAPARAGRKQNPIPVDSKSLGQGKELFVMACVPCHGPGGRGDGPAAATLERNGVRVRPGNLSLPQMWQQSDGELFWKISEGRTPMPTWKETLSEEQRWLIVNYVRTLAPPGAYTNETITAQARTK